VVVSTQVDRHDRGWNTRPPALGGATAGALACVGAAGVRASPISKHKEGPGLALVDTKEATASVCCYDTAT
jgi:hypothetical protein